MEADTLYAVVITFPDDIARLLDGLRKDYKRFVGYTIEPHITLKMPFKLKADKQLMLDALRSAADDAGPFTLVLDGVRFFEGPNNVAYAALKDERPVKELHSVIVESLRGLVEERGGEVYETENFTPHLTIGEHLPDGIFPEVKKDLGSRILRFECPVSSFSLYSGTFTSRWLPERVFDFQADKGDD